MATANVGRIPLLDLGERQAPLLFSDLAAAAAVCAAMLASAAHRSLRLDWTAMLALLFASVGGISALAAGPRFGLTGFEIVASLAYLARWLLYFGVYVAVINHVRERHVWGVWHTLERTLLLLAAFGVVQAIFLPNFALMVYPDQVGQWDAQRNRLVSTILDPNIASGVLLIGLLVQLAQLACGARVSVWKPLLLLVAMVMTLSRSGVAGLIIGAIVILFATRKLSKRVMRFIALAMVGFVISLPKLIPFALQYSKLGVTDDSAAARLITWGRAVEVFLENPWFGIGFNTYGFVQERRGIERVSGVSYSAEGGLLFIAVMTGIVGLVVFLGMLWMVFRKCRLGWRERSASPAERGLFIGTAAATAAILVHTVFVNSLFVPFVMEPLWVLWGLAFVTRERLRLYPADSA